MGYWDVVAFDEFAGREKTANKALVDIMKNYMANKSFSRGINPMGAEASFSFVGNTDTMCRSCSRTATCSRHCRASSTIPPSSTACTPICQGGRSTSSAARCSPRAMGSSSITSPRSFGTSGRRTSRTGRTVLQGQREDFYAGRDAIYKTLSGLLKVIFPDGSQTEAEVEELLRLAMESRKRVKDQLARIDSTYPEVDFHYLRADGTKSRVTTVEEEEFPQFYHLRPMLDPKAQDTAPASEDEEQRPEDIAAPVLEQSQSKKADVSPAPAEGHHEFTENRKGLSYDKLFGAYLKGARRIVVTDPYIRFFYQIRNMMEFVEMVIRRTPPEDQVSIHLVTGPDEGNISRQRDLLDSISAACTGTGVSFTWAFDTSGTAHARDIVTDTGWKIVLDRGLDIFQAPIKTDGFSLGDRLQEHRMLKSFYVTYVRLEGSQAVNAAM